MLSRTVAPSEMVMESQTLPKVDGKSLEFEIQIHDAQFNRKDWYMLECTLMNSHSTDFSQVMVARGDSGVFSVQHTVKTDYTKQEENAPLSFFKDKKFTFRLPKGFCKNDKNYEVYLLVEAFATSDSTSDRLRKVGEGKFAIYPRPNAPRMNLFAEPGEDYYRYSDIMSLLRTHSTENIQMHCGRIRSTYALREVVPPKPKSPKRKTPPRKRSLHQELSPLPTPLTPRTGRTIPTPTESSYRQQSQRNRPMPPPTAESGSSWGENFSITLPPSPPLPPAADDKQMPETPQKHGDYKSFYTGKTYRHVASHGKEQIDVILHGATSLPMLLNGSVPQPFGIIKTKRDEDQGRKAGATTHATVQQTHAPCWEELVSLEVDENSADDDTLVVSVADADTQKGLVNYRVPVNYLTPFHQYHIELNMPARGIPSGVRTYASITRKLPRLPKDPACPNYLALEVLLRNVQKPIKSPLGPLIAVARIVTDYYNYRSDNLQSHPHNTGVMMHNVTFPSAHPSNFVISEQSYQGHPQLSLPGRPDHRPEWNYPYLFVGDREKATLFVPGAALVIEYYVAAEGRTRKQTMSDQFWKMQSPVAYSAVLMDVDMYKHLTATRAKNGLRLEGVPMQPIRRSRGGNMIGEDGKRPTVGMILRLITTENPEVLVSTSNYDDVPLLDMFPPSEFAGYFQAESPDILKIETAEPPADTELDPDSLSLRSIPRTPQREPRKSHHRPKSPSNAEEPTKSGYVLQRVEKRPLSPLKEDEMPPYDVMESVLPEYQYIFEEGTEGKRRSPTARAPPAPSTSGNPYDDDIMDKGSMNLIDHQSKELKNYRGAVQKMGRDILTLRSQIRELENLNSNLRRDLASLNDTQKIMADTSELEGITKAEMLSRFAVLKRTLSAQTSDLKTYKTKLQSVQNDLIKKNDDEKNYLKVQRAHATQQQAIQKLQDKLKKLKKLEDACKQQESVIQKMERIVEKQHKDRGKSQKDDKTAEANEVLLQENKRLRDRISEFQSQLHAAGGVSSRDDMERMDLLQALERSEARVTSLETQMASNARQWGKERAEQNLRLNELQHGLSSSTGMIFHDFPGVPISNERFNPNKAGMKRLSPVYR